MGIWWMTGSNTDDSLTKYYSATWLPILCIYFTGPYLLAQLFEWLASMLLHFLNWLLHLLHTLLFVPCPPIDLATCHDSTQLTAWHRLLCVCWAAMIQAYQTHQSYPHTEYLASAGEMISNTAQCYWSLSSASGIQGTPQMCALRYCGAHKSNHPQWVDDLSSSYLLQPLPCM